MFFAVNNKEEKFNNYLKADITSIGMSFFAQLFLCIIFWQLGNDKKPDDDNSEFPETEVADFDEHADLMSKIWN